MDAAPLALHPCATKELLKTKEQPCLTILTQPLQQQCRALKPSSAKFNATNRPERPVSCSAAHYPVQTQHILNGNCPIKLLRRCAFGTLRSSAPDAADHARSAPIYPPPEPGWTVLTLNQRSNPMVFAPACPPHDGLVALSPGKLSCMRACLSLSSASEGSSTQQDASHSSSNRTVQYVRAGLHSSTKVWAFVFQR